MTHNWFETKIRYSKMQENGVEKKVTESYLVDALNCTMVFDFDPYTQKGKEFSLLQVFKMNKEEFDLGNRVFIKMKVNELNNE